FMKYAAIFIGIVVIMGIGVNFFKKETGSNSVNQSGSHQVVLQLSNGEVQKIGDGQDKVITNDEGVVIGKKTGNTITYNNLATTPKLVYNQIVVPEGKQFKLVLSDSTVVWLNSETQLKYPIH